MVKRKQGTESWAPVPDIPAPKRPKKQTSVTVRSHSARVTRSSAKAQTTAAARDAVFGTTELLENILIQLPPRNIVRVQRVNRLFKETVEKSPSAQKLLQPAACTGEKRWTARYDSAQREVYYGTLDLSDRPSQDVRVSSLNKAVFATLCAWTHVNGTIRRGGETVKFVRDHMMQGFLHHMRGQQQSYEGMQITQPPTTRVTVRYEVHFGRHAIMLGRQIDVTQAEGVTVGDIFRTILGVHNRSIHTPDGELVGIKERRQMGSHTARVTKFPSHDQPVSETIRQLEERHGTKARVVDFDVLLCDVVVPTEQEIASVESEPRFAMI